METVIIAILFLVIWLLAIFILNNNATNKLKNMINNDNSIVDYINTLDGWSISNVPSKALTIIVYPKYKIAKKYYLYVTYKEREPIDGEIEKLYKVLIRDGSPFCKVGKFLPFEFYKVNIKEVFLFFKRNWIGILLLILKIVFTLAGFVFANVMLRSCLRS